MVRVVVNQEGCNESAVFKALLLAERRNKHAEQLPPEKPKGRNRQRLRQKQASPSLRRAAMFGQLLTEINIDFKLKLMIGMKAFGERTAYVKAVCSGAFQGGQFIVVRLI